MCEEMYSDGHAIVREDLCISVNIIVHAAIWLNRCVSMQTRDFVPRRMITRSVPIMKDIKILTQSYFLATLLFSYGGTYLSFSVLASLSLSSTFNSITAR